MKLVKFTRNQIWKFFYLIRTGASLWLIIKGFWLGLTHMLTRVKYEKKRAAFREQAKSLTLDNDWFSSNIHTWLRALETQSFYEKDELNCLEIGSWQGLSAYFILSELQNARLTCVDTWEGADEHQEGSDELKKVLSRIEESFDHNLRDYLNRLQKYKGTSFAFFNDHFEPSVYDLVYIDGSHHSDDVMVDAIKGFEMLKVGGIMIFDDYLWQRYDTAIDNPAGAVNSFLRMKHHQLELIAFDYQLAIRKTKRSIRYIYDV